MGQLKTLVKQRYGALLGILLAPFIAWQLKKTVEHFQKNIEVMLQQNWS